MVPASGATGVPLNANIQITFSSAAKASTVNATNIQVTDPKAVSGTVTYNANNNSATFTPAAALVANSTYTVTVSGVTSADGTGLANPYKSNFATVAATAGGGGGGGTGGGGTGGGGTGGGGTGGGSTGTAATLQYQAPLLAGASALNGNVSVDTTGNVTVQLTGATASTTYQVQFCQAVSEINPPTAPISCLDIEQVSTDAKGSGSSTVKFPQSGSWAGEFNVDSGGKVVYGTWLTPGLNGETFLATLQPATTVNGYGIANPGDKQSPLTSGTVTYSNGSVTFTLTGAEANTLYETNESETNYVNSSGTYGLNTFTTDAKGNSTTSTSLDGIGGDMFQVGPQNYQSTAGYIGGFSIPK